jgi:twinkle protein
MSSDFVRKEPCLACGSKDNLARYSDGHAHCFGCGHWEPPTDYIGNEDYMEDSNNMQPVQTKGFSGSIPERNISKTISAKYGVRISHGEDGRINKHYYPYYDNKTGDLVGYKERDVATKGFQLNGTNKGAGLFGQNIFKEGGKYLTITEGELDALSISEMFDGKWAVVSLKNGASGALRDVKDNLDYIESFDNVVLCFDQDEAGKEAEKAVRDIISPNKLRMVTLPMKDASDMLMNSRIKDFTESWWNAKGYTPAGIVRGEDTWEHLQKDENLVTVLYPWSALNEVTYGFRQKELVTITSGSGMGKSSVVKELEAHILNETDDNLAIIHLEESIDRSVKGLMSIEANLPIHIPKYEEMLSKEEKKELWQTAVADKNVFFYDHFGSMSEDSLLSVIRTYAKSFDCKWIILDHLSIVVSSQEGIQDERKAIDAIMTKLRKIVQETGIGLFLVSHLKRPQGKAHEEGGQVSLSELRGSAAIAQLSDIVIGLERNQQADEEKERNTTTLRVIKNRFCGLTGKAGQLLYDKETGRLKETNAPTAESFF